MGGATFLSLPRDNTIGVDTSWTEKRGLQPVVETLQLNAIFCLTPIV
ncbi:hypothetical protein CLAFUW4_12960 [Fulvia fulva]|nr:uncharacterized protein CLAFUR5_20341 [Fulvia fulva]KAK4611691.1 hypothetical protein CLAFUR4_12964 [Fulvia fulva]KAK4612370.1 hypothetical protein CLAFUR0_12969 [Fulvia fulva]WMI39045.1 hypothetical protein CLAFUR5_20341 [Fulvia fulva]WPV20894.1 hypothetical protein CLAFUW4_12960 [Fulvia fulva]WPV35887.1 hypothetical protein CLAFUW7_12967 [Fulvia fulva]